MESQPEVGPFDDMSRDARGLRPRPQLPQPTQGLSSAEEQWELEYRRRASEGPRYEYSGDNPGDDDTSAAGRSFPRALLPDPTTDPKWNMVRGSLVVYVFISLVFFPPPKRPSLSFGKTHVGFLLAFHLTPMGHCTGWDWIARSLSRGEDEPSDEDGVPPLRRRAPRADGEEQAGSCEPPRQRPTLGERAGGATTGASCRGGVQTPRRVQRERKGTASGHRGAAHPAEAQPRLPAQQRAKIRRQRGAWRSGGSRRRR